MISLDYTILYQIALFVVLFFVLDRLLFRPYLALLEQRERQTLGAQDETRALIHEGERLKARYEEAIAQAQAAGSATKAATLHEARQQCEKILGQAREQASHSLAQSRREIQSLMQKERQLAAAEVASIAQQMMSKILGRQVP